MKIGKKGKLVLQVFGFLLFLVILGLICLGYYADQVGPKDYVAEGKEIRADDILRVKELGLLEPDETMLMFYSWGLLDISEGCILLTDRHFISYSKLWEQPLEKHPYDQIAETKLDSGISLSSDLIVTFADGSMWSFPISKLRTSDKRFIAKLNEMVEAAQNPTVE